MGLEPETAYRKTQATRKSFAAKALIAPKCTVVQRRNTRLLILVIGLTAALASPASHAQPEGASTALGGYTRQSDPYAGLVADSTVSFIGQEFYRAFMMTWRELGMTERYSLSIHERPSARWGSLVWIEFANRRVFSMFLSPGRRDAVALAGGDAARLAYQNVVDADLQRLLFKDPDLAPDEF